MSASLPLWLKFLNRNWGFDGRMGIVAFESNIVEGEVVDGFDVGIEAQGGKRTRFAGQLEAGLVKMVLIEMQISEGVDEITSLVITNLSDQMCEERIGGDVEWHPKEKIRTALVKLAGEARLAARLGLVDIELEKQVAGREGHAIDIAHIPR